jgi:hypothetical protein
VVCECSHRTLASAWPSCCSSGTCWQLSLIGPGMCASSSCSCTVKPVWVSSHGVTVSEPEDSPEMVAPPTGSAVQEYSPGLSGAFPPGPVNVWVKSSPVTVTDAEPGGSMATSSGVVPWAASHSPVVTDTAASAPVWPSPSWACSPRPSSPSSPAKRKYDPSPAPAIRTTPRTIHSHRSPPRRGAGGGGSP